MKATLPQINADIARRHPGLDIELVKGKGYFYFAGHDGMGLGIDSIYVCHLNQCDLDWWLENVNENIERAIAAL
jgi:hypothetical protein